MEGTTEEPIGSAATAIVDQTYEFLAPRWFDFVNGETEGEARRAELWFASALSCAPSPSVPRIKARRCFKVETMCNFNEEEEEDKRIKDEEPSEPVAATIASQPESDIISEAKKEEGDTTEASTIKPTHSRSKDAADASNTREKTPKQIENKENIPPSRTEACTPKPPLQSSHGGKSMDLKKQQTARKIASLLRNPSALRPKNQPHSSSQLKGTNQKSVKRETSPKNIAGTTSLIQDNQAIKKQKLDDGKSRQILNPKPTTLLHKTRQGLVNTGFNVCPSVTKQTPKENRKVYVREQVAPFMSTAELMKKFQTSTRDLSLPHANPSLPQNRTKLTLTRPKEPEFVTSQRARPVRVKSSAELEEEMLAKIPKFKARPVNKKILAAPALPAPQRSTPQLPEFQEFHLETMARASQHAETSSIASTEVSKQHNDCRPPHLTAPKSPVLQTMLRARPTKAKTTAELEQEELEKAPKFKAKPLNKKIFESKGEMGIFCNMKKHITIPQEFHFATDERISQPCPVVDIFDKLSLTSDSCHEKPLPRNTAPNPFNLRTEERGAEKEKKFVMEITQKLIGDERARVPKANPYPYTTDYPVVPQKPEPKQCTKPEPFQLESLVRHEDEVRREREERMRMEREEAQKRLFKAQPVIKEDPIPVPEKVRKPLTEIQEFNLHVETRAVERADFDQKIKEKENQYKRYREESEAAKMVEEERFLKQMRKTMVPHARPVPKFNKPFLPQKSSKEITKPKSPNLRVIKRTERRTMMAPPTVSAATSASAGQMR
ncbi:unnamed protein product [Brassica oleracea var. botrytis]|uniref:TPX2 C-terminal domain-containing protein n=1 Tax=Brassica oleracea var. oleracea TaxID=109376 RepID=A0A0D3C7D8_BRAOL|nr:PREDICTED: protein TPX2-like [Brassica oleracea var. oleracea]